MSDESGGTKTLHHEIDASVYEEFLKAVEHREGTTYGNTAICVEEALELFAKFYGPNGEEPEDEVSEDSNSATLADQVMQLVGGASESGMERERRAVSNPSNPTQQRAEEIRADLPDSEWVSEDLVNAIIGTHAGESYKTLKKYRQILVREGDLIPSPVPGNDEYATSPQKVALVCEHHEKISLADIDRIVGEYADKLGDDWYLDALPGTYIQNNQLRYEKLENIDGSVDEYREENGLLGEDTPGFQ